MGFNCFAVSVLYYVDMSNHMCKLHLKKYHINGDDPSPDHIPLMTGTLMNGSPKTLETSEEGMTALSIGSGDPKKNAMFRGGRGVQIHPSCHDDHLPLLSNEKTEGNGMIKSP